MRRQHVTFIHDNDIATYAIIFGDSQKPRVPQALRGFAGILIRIYPFDKGTRPARSPAMETFVGGL